MEISAAQTDPELLQCLAGRMMSTVQLSQMSPLKALFQTFSLNRGNLKRGEMRDRCAQSLGVWPSYIKHSQNIQRGHRLCGGQGDPVSWEPVK